MIIHHIENQNQNQRSDFCLLNQWDKIWHHSSQIDAWKRDWPRMVLVYTIWVKIIWYRFIWFAVSQFNLDQIQVSSLNFFNFKKFLAPAFLKILLQTGSSFTPVSCLSTFLLVRSYIPLKGKLLALLISGMLDPMVLCGFIPVQLSIFHPNPLIWTPVPIFKLPRGGFPITVSPYVCLVGVDYGWLNIRVLRGALWLLRGCMIPTKNSSDPTFTISNENCFIPALLVWAGCSVTIFLGGYTPSEW